MLWGSQIYSFSLIGRSFYATIFPSRCFLTPVHPVRVAGDEVFPGAGAGGGHGAGGLVEVAQGGGKGVSGVEFFQE